MIIPKFSKGDTIISTYHREKPHVGVVIGYISNHHHPSIMYRIAWIDYKNVMTADVITVDRNFRLI